MDYSVKAYIDKLSTEKLERFVEQFYADELPEDYSYIIPYIHYVLDRRQSEPQQ